MGVGAKFQVTEEGQRLVREIKLAAANYRPAIDNAVKHIAKSCASDVKKVIMSQVFPNARISQAWLARKARQGMDTRVLLATKTYYNSIEEKQLKQGEWGVVCNDISLRNWLEHGTSRGNPPRPHWTPVLADYQQNFGDKFAKALLTEIFGGLI